MLIYGIGNPCNIVRTDSHKIYGHKHERRKSITLDLLNGELSAELCIYYSDQRESGAAAAEEGCVMRYGGRRCGINEIRNIVMV